MAFLCSCVDNPGYCRGPSVTFGVIDGWETSAAGPIVLGVTEAEGTRRQMALVDGGAVDVHDLPTPAPHPHTVLIDPGDGDVIEVRAGQDDDL